MSYARTRRSREVAFLLSLLLPLPVIAAGKVERLEIVDRSIERHGGELFRHVEISLTLSSLSGSFDIVSAVSDGRFDYTVERLRDGVRQRWHQTNDGVWRSDDGVEIELDDEGRRRAMDFVSARLYFCFLPWRLNDPSTFKEDLGVETWEGRTLHKVKVTFTSGSSTDADDEYLYWFDPDSAQLVQFAYSFKANDGGLRFRRLVDYRRIGGILFADQENYAVDGGGLSVDQITPQFVNDSMRMLSKIELRDIHVRPLADVQGAANEEDPGTLGRR